MTENIREKYLKVVDMKGCGWIPCRVGLFPSTWYKYKEKLEALVLNHKKLFPNFMKGSIKYNDPSSLFGIRRAGNSFLDDWGCLWRFNIDGLQGQVVKHPLEDWSNFKNYSPPDPDKGIVPEGEPAIPWETIETHVENARRRGDVVVVGFPHGFFFMRLHYLRGFTNLMKDFVLEPPELEKLIEVVTNYNLELIDRVIKLKPDVVSFGDDLGLQDRMPISEKKFRKFIFPSYRRIFQRVRSSGARVYLHSDGHIMEVVDDLIEAGVSVINLQDRVNGVENIEKKIKGRVCIDLDVDRQYVVPFGTPEMIREHIKNVVVSLGSKEGGLMLYSEIHADVPLENINAVCDAMEEYMNYFNNC